MIAILDYGMGDLHSIENALQHIGCIYCVTDKKENLQRADQLILPGVGVFTDYMRHLQERDLIAALREKVQGKKKPLPDICLGIQALFEDSGENGYTEGLSFSKGSIVKMSDATESRSRIPHIGWNLLEQCQESSIFERLSERPLVYYIHSYYTRSYARENLLADSGYSEIRIPGLVRKGNVVGAQLRLGKSGEDGLQVLRWFKEEFV